MERQSHPLALDELSAYELFLESRNRDQKYLWDIVYVAARQRHAAAEIKDTSEYILFNEVALGAAADAIRTKLFERLNPTT